MRRLALGLSLMGCLLAPATSLALGLGSIEVRTTLNQPLRANIKLLGTNSAELQGLSIRLAPSKLFQQVGIPRPDYLGNLQFKVVHGANGEPYIQITTPNVVKQPFLDFLLEVNWSGGRLVREYTVLLNPPNYMQGKPEVATRVPTAAPILTVKRQPASTTTAPASQPSTTQSAGVSSSAAPTRYRVRRGDTLRHVATLMRPNRATSVNQMMVALVRTNPHAFIQGNVNGLKWGYVLRMPSTGMLSGLSQSQANAEVQRQNSLWRAYAARMAGHAVPQSQLKGGGTAAGATQTAASPSGKSSRLKIMGTEPSASGTGKSAAQVSTAGTGNAAKLNHQLALAQESAASNQQKISDLTSRLQALKSIVEKQQKLIALQSQELANLQHKLGANATSNAPPKVSVQAAASTTQSAAAGMASATTISRPAAVAASGTMAAPASAAVAPATTAATPAQVKAPQPASKPKASPTPVAPKPSPQPSFIADLMGNPNMLMAAGGIVLLLLALLWLVVRRSAKEREPEQPAPVREMTDEPEFGAMDAPAEAEETNALYAEEAPEEAAADEFEETVGEAKPVEEEPPAATPVASAKATEMADDVLAEADVYIAYGLYSQAEDALRKALNESPERNDYRAKLLECYFATKNTSVFEAEAKELHAGLSHPEVDPLWIRVAALGKELVPDNPLFTGTDTGGLTAADVLAAESIDGELDLGESEFDLGDLSGMDAESDFDLGELPARPKEEVVEEVDLSGESAESGRADLEFDDLEVGSFDQTEEESTTAVVEPDEFGESAPIEPSVEEDLPFEKATASAESVVGLSESDEHVPSVEEKLDELDFDLDDLDITTDANVEETGGDNVGLDLDIGDLPEVASTEDGNGDYESLDLDTGAFDLEGETVAFDESAKTGEAGTEQAFSLDELPEPGTGLESGAESDTEAETAQAFSLDDLPEPGAGLESGSESDSEAETEQAFSLDDLPEPEAGLEAETEMAGEADTVGGSIVGDEIATKLDLAKAYIDMGDAEGAQSTLEEVMAEGSDEQKKEADALLKQLG